MSPAAATAETDAVLTGEVRSWIGRETDLLPLPDEISSSDVRRYLEATGDQNPLWRNDDAARAAGYRARVVPPMLLIELVWRLKNTDEGRMTDKVPLPPAYTDTRNVDNEIEWLEPAYVGDRISIRHRIRDIACRSGRRGLGVYITRETEYLRSDGRLLARAMQTVARFPKAAVESH